MHRLWPCRFKLISNWPSPPSTAAQLQLRAGPTCPRPSTMSSGSCPSCGRGLARMAACPRGSRPKLMG
eukprot:2044878-Pyramimonas_sp.AAC.1